MSQEEVLERELKEAKGGNPQTQKVHGAWSISGNQMVPDLRCLDLQLIVGFMMLRIYSYAYVDCAILLNTADNKLYKTFNTLLE